MILKITILLLTISTFSTFKNQLFAQVYDVSTATYAGSSEEFDIGIDAFHSDITFNDNGTKMFTSIFGTAAGDDQVREYSLSTVYDVSTASFNSNLNVSSEQEGLTGVTFNDDGTKMYIIGNNPAAISQYSLSTAFDISTASYDGSSEELSVSAQQVTPTGLTFNNDGSRLFIIGLGSNFGGADDEAISEYDLSTNYDVSTGSFNGVSEELDVSGEDIFPTDLTFNDTGSLLFIVGATDDAVVEYSLPTVFDVSTATHSGTSEELDISSQEGEPRGIAFSGSGDGLFVHGFDDAVIEYTIIDIVPVELLYFSVNIGPFGKVSIEWETASEMNSDFFTIERSEDGIFWEILTEIKGAGNSSERKQYSWTDEEPINGVSYYRLKQDDFDGSFEYLETKSIERKYTEIYTVFPNPASDIINIDLNGKDPNIENIFFHDSFGNSIGDLITINKTVSGMTANVEQISPGVYFISIGANVSRFLIE